MGRGNVKYDFDRSFFKEIDSPVKAYYLGFFMGRGSIKGSDEYFSFNFKRKNKYILENLLKDIGGSPEQIKYYHYPGSHPVVYLSLSSKEMVEDLIRHGIPSKNKSANMKPVDLDFELQPYFWRGLFDVKGHLSRRNKHIFISLYGNIKITDSFRKFIGYGDVKLLKTDYDYLFQKSLVFAEEMKRFYYLVYGGDLPLSNKGLLLKEMITEREAYEKVKFAEDPDEIMYKEYRNDHNSIINDESEVSKSKLFNYMISPKFKKNREKESKEQ